MKNTDIKNSGEIPLFDWDDKKLISFAYRSGIQNLSDSANSEMMRRMKVAIMKFNEKSSKQTFWVILLTIAIFILGIIQTIILISQIFS